MVGGNGLEVLSGRAGPRPHARPCLWFCGAAAWRPSKRIGFGLAGWPAGWLAGRLVGWEWSVEAKMVLGRILAKK